MDYRMPVGMGYHKSNMASEYGGDSASRVKGISIIKPVIYGNIARYFGKKREEDGHTHQWTVYVKPYRNEDMSVYVKKVHFKLHDSYANQNRVVTKPPYEVTETGWGEFEIVIKIYFNDPNEKSVTIYHLLKLFQSETDIALGKKSLVVEIYDELVFHEPTALMQQLLTSTRPLTLSAYKHETDFEDKKTKTLSNIMSAKNKIRHEIQELNERLKQSKDAISKFKDEIRTLETQDGKPPVARKLEVMT
ncbi:YEATS domain-containing protein 4-like [Lineus longissimus]|uniref:YEATS domain-containing protein 4-like n=1 Tax=Lineus longissimus TaxID=88925 RepID=UPI002B4EAABC